MTQVVKKQEKTKIDKATIKRVEKAQELVNAGKITRIVRPEEVYKVESAKDPNVFYKVYVSNMVAVSCSCPDYKLHFEKNKDHTCKHMSAVNLAEDFSYVKRELESFRTDQYDF